MERARLKLDAAAVVVCAAVCALVAVANLGAAADSPQPRVHRIELGPDLQRRAQTALINVRPGETIEFAEGRFEFTATLSLDVEGVTIRGQGPERTILNFQKQGPGTGSEGLLVTKGRIVIHDLTVEDAIGDGIKVHGVQGVTIRNVRAVWTGEPKTANGGYGIYPVECGDVLVEDCFVRGASDAGVYVGQSRNVIVRRNRVTENVAGIEIENCVGADVHDNEATGNTGGILVFSLPNLPLKNGHDCRVFKNRIVENNQDNFAAEGNIVGMVPPGTGLMILAFDRVEVFDNTFQNNQTANLAVASYLITEKKYDDAAYDAFPEAIDIHDNKFEGGGDKPRGKLGTVLGALAGGKFPDIAYDGIPDEKKLVDNQGAGKQLPPELRIVIHDNGGATFVNFDLANFDTSNLFSAKFPKISRDLAPHAGHHPPLPAVEIDPAALAPHVAASSGAAPEPPFQKLSDYGLFVGNLADHQPAARVVPYDLNTPLFSDYTTKLRFVKLPPGTQAIYRDADVFDFPVGTVISKTFAYEHDLRDPKAGCHLLETRILLHKPDGWIGLPYVWNAEQTEAFLDVAGQTVDVHWLDTAGHEQSNHYLVPNVNQCKGCHEGAQAFAPIGPKARHLNKDFAYAERTENQLAHWTRQGILTGAPSPDQAPRSAAWDDPSSGTLDQRARAWLEINCAHCHNPAGGARNSGLDLTATQIEPARFGVFKSPVAAGSGSGGLSYDIVPGKPDESILLYRINSIQPKVMMPELGRRMIHAEGLDLVRQWIAQMKSEVGGGKSE